MTLLSSLRRFRPHSVPIGIFAVVAVSAVIVPPVVLGEATVRTYTITAAVVILAVGAGQPFALFVGISTLPFLYTGVASFAAPSASGETAYAFSALTVVRHVVAGVAYSLASAVLGAIGIGAQMGIPAGGAPGSVGGQPAFLIMGGLIIAGIFIGLQLWRYGTQFRSLDRQTILGTGVLGLLLALSPVAAFWVFNNAS